MPLPMCAAFTHEPNNIVSSLINCFSTSESVVVYFLIQPNSYFSLMFWQG